MKTITLYKSNKFIKTHLALPTVLSGTQSYYSLYKMIWSKLGKNSKYSISEGEYIFLRKVYVDKAVVNCTSVFNRPKW